MCILPSFLRRVCRRNMMARILAYKPDPGNGVGLHYSRFRRYSPSPIPLNQLLALDAREPGAIVLGAREQVAVALEGHLDRRVPEQLLQSLGTEPGLDPDRR